MSHRLLVCGLLAFLLVAGGVSLRPAHAALTPDQKKEIEEIRKELGKVQALIGKKDQHEEAEKLLNEAETKLKKIGKDAGDENNKLITGLLRQIELKKTALARRDAPAKGVAAAGAALSFEKEIAPILVKNCLGCHDDTASGGLKFDTFASLAAGCGGKLVVPGNPDASILTRRLVAAGEARMPKGGKALAPDEIRKIATWIAGGAKFAGNKDTLLSELTADANAKVDNTPVAIATATGSEKVSFQRDIAPFMVNLCVNCHSGANPRAGFSLETFEKLMKGGRSGRVVLPGNTEDSRLWHLVGKQDPIKMPQGQALITRTNHTNLRVWIEEGAKFDGPDPKAPLRSLVPTEAELRAAELAKLSPEELVNRRIERATSLWKKTTQEAPATIAQGEQVMVLGNVSEDRLKQYVAWGDDAAKQVASIFKASETPLWRGKLAVFVFSDRFTYSEFVQTNEARELLPEIQAHVRIRDPEDAYLCLMDIPDDTTDSPGAPGMVLAQVTEAFLQRGGKTLPEWVSRGTGLALAARNDAKNEYYRQLGVSAGARMQTLQKPDDLLKDGTFSPADLGPVGYSLVAYMLRQGEPQYVQFVSALLAGKTLDESLKGVYNADAAKVAASYLASGAAGPRNAPRKKGK
jgi:mono/diheme cytochrome c family protein